MPANLLPPVIAIASRRSRLLSTFSSGLVIPIASRHSREGGNPNPRYRTVQCVPIPPAQAGLLMTVETWSARVWIPAFAGMTRPGGNDETRGNDGSGQLQMRLQLG